MVRICGSPFGVVPSGAKRREAEAHLGLVVDLAQVVVQPLDLQPVRVRGDHAPGGQVVQGRAPEHGLLAAGVHGDVAADGGGILGGGVHGEGEPMGIRQVGDPAGHHTGPAEHRRHLAGDPGQGTRSTAERDSSFSVLMTAQRSSSGTPEPV